MVYTKIEQSKKSFERRKIIINKIYILFLQNQSKQDKNNSQNEYKKFSKKQCSKPKPENSTWHFLQRPKDNLTLGNGRRSES